MKHYTMASVPNPSIIKQPLKLVEIPLNKFFEEVIPHHQKLLDEHKAIVLKVNLKSIILRDNMHRVFLAGNGERCRTTDERNKRQETID